MNLDPKGITTIDEYIAMFPSNIQEKLIEMRSVIRATAPQAQEKISYRMPTFTLHGNLVHFAAHQNHIGFYPTPGAIEAFSAELSTYEKSKGAVRFPFDQPIPVDLVRRMVLFRVAENEEKAMRKKKIESKLRG
ncbi:MAG: DUF1801 domain-containing protein [Anaerolineaceae bacterium]|nr:DUF1801 domain-containing protein [Anaerolineaceae bacterium]